MKIQITQQLICVGIVAVLLGTALVLQAVQQKDSQPKPDNQSTVSTERLEDDFRPPQEDDYEQQVALRQPDSQLKLSCDGIKAYSGPFVEDGSDREVENVASIFITNRSGRYLERAELTYEVDGRTARFVVTGLHAGMSAWVLEENALTASNDSRYVYVDGSTTYLNQVNCAPIELSISTVEQRLRVENVSERTLENVIIYYKTLCEDGAYLGGISYAVGIGTLRPDDTIEKLAGKFGDNSEIVCVVWR